MAGACSRGRPLLLPHPVPRPPLPPFASLRHATLIVTHQPCGWEGLTVGAGGVCAAVSPPSPLSQPPVGLLTTSSPWPSRASAPSIPLHPTPCTHWQPPTRSSITYMHFHGYDASITSGGHLINNGHGIEMRMSPNTSERVRLLHTT